MRNGGNGYVLPLVSVTHKALPDPAGGKATLTPRQRERRERILAATLAMTGARGYDGVSMRAIAAQSGVTERTLYNNFGSKDRLIAIAARQRSSRIFEEAARLAPEGGAAFLLCLPGHLARATLDEPQMARVLAQVLLDHSELVGLNQVYLEFIGAALAQMEADGDLTVPDMRDVLVRLLRLSFVSSVVLWARGEISDDELEAHLTLHLCQIVLPVADTRLGTRLRTMCHERMRDLATGVLVNGR